MQLPISGRVNRDGCMHAVDQWFSTTKSTNLRWLFVCWLIALGPCLALALCIRWLDTDGRWAPKNPLEGHSFWFNIFHGGLVGPFVETFILLGPVLFFFRTQ
jgi:hypothetical protein